MRIPLLFIIVLVASAQAISYGTAYTNPVATGTQGVADPFVLKYNGEYYLYTSTLPIRVYHSFDLVTWDFYKEVLSPNSSSWNQCDLWAPEVTYKNGVFYMYYAASLCSTDFLTNELNRRIGVATSSSPITPFTDSGKPVTDDWGIDAHYFKDPDSGEEYLFYSFLYEYLPGVAPSMGTGISVDEFTAWNAVANSPDAATRGTDTQEDKDGNWENGSLRYTNEGPTVIKRRGQYYLIFSHGSWDMPSYALSYAVSEDVLSQKGIWGPMWNKTTPPFLRETDKVDAPGHNSIVKAPNNVDDICVNHGRPAPFQNVGQRAVFIDRLFYNDDRLYMNPPSLAFITAPDQPLFSDIFQRPDSSTLGSYNVISGNWSVKNYQALQLSSEGLSTAMLSAPALLDYVFEANFQFLNSSAGSAVGVAAYLIDANNYVYVWVNIEETGAAVLLLQGVINGKNISETSAPIPSTFVPTTYHQLLVTKNGYMMGVALDGVNMISVEIGEIQSAPGRVALITNNVGAYFDGIALTSFFEDLFENGMQWTNETGSAWEIKNNVLVQNELSTNTEGNFYVVRGQASTRYEFSADVLFMNSNANGSASSQVGIVAAMSSDQQIIFAGFSKNIWPMANFVVTYQSSPSNTQTFSASLPRGFLYDVYHNIRVVRQGTAFSFFLDGQETIDVYMGFTQPSVAGLFTSSSATASFDAATYKWVTLNQNYILNGGFEDQQNNGASPTTGNVWQFQGDVTFSPCCAFAGARQVMATGSGQIQQTVPLQAGNYTLYVYTQNADYTTQSCGLVVMVNQVQFSAMCEGEKWRLLEVPFVVPGNATVEVIWWAKVAEGQVASVDEFYIVSQ